ncbi:MAG: VPLPA-CTERM sorting domain-containing protein [Paracoccaceae bacterium]
MSKPSLSVILFCLSAGTALPALASPVYFSTGEADGRMASVSRPATLGRMQIETADDFLLTADTMLTGASFTGLLPDGVSLASVLGVTVNIYRLFPLDSDTTRPSAVPTRAGSPADGTLTSLSSGAGDMTFAASLGGGLDALNSIQPGGIHAAPNQTTGGNGPVSGQVVTFDLTFLTGLSLTADQYFFVPEVDLGTAGSFYWLSAASPVDATGTPFADDLPGWVRDDTLAPDWLRVGKDIVGTGSYNFAFSLTGQTVETGAVPLPASLPLLAGGMAALGLRRRRK